jgi:hypothetical protein
MAFWLPFILIAVAIGGVTVVTIYLINRRNLKKIAIEKAKNGELSAKIKSLHTSGNYNTVTVGLLDKYGSETSQLEIKADSIEYDFCVGEVIRLNN